MIKNYLQIACRHLWRPKIFSLISVMGLAACFLFFLYAHVEPGYDPLHTRSDRTYREVSTASVPAQLAHTGMRAWANAPVFRLVHRPQIKTEQQMTPKESVGHRCFEGTAIKYFGDKEPTLIQRLCLPYPGLTVGFLCRPHSWLCLPSASGLSAQPSPIL